MASKKQQIPDLKFEDLKVGQVYRSKKPKLLGVFERLVDDRQILYISEFRKPVGHIDHGYTPEFENWCKQKSWPSRSLTSEMDQREFEQESDFKLSARNIETVWDYMIQYDSPSVKFGQKHPMIPASKFLKWAANNITETLPKGEWATSL